MEPVCNADGTKSDHKTVYVRARIQRVPDYEVESYSYLHQTEKGDRLMGEFLDKVNWDAVTLELEPTKCVEKLHEIFKLGMNSCYKEKKRKKKSCNPPWVDEKLLSMIRTRRAVFREHQKRSPAWKQLKQKTEAYVKKRKAAYNLGRKEKMLNANGREFHACVRSFTNDEQVKKWNPRSIFPELSESECAERFAAFVNNISNKYRPIDITHIPNSFSKPIPQPLR